MSNSDPNIMFIFSDQHRHDVLGCAGHPVVQTRPISTDLPPRAYGLPKPGVRARYASHRGRRSPRGNTRINSMCSAIPGHWTQRGQR